MSKMARFSTMSCDFSLKYHSAIRREKRVRWRQYITDLPRCNIWMAAKYAMADPGSSLPRP
jgi:hypothetical protein